MTDCRNAVVPVSRARPVCPIDFDSPAAAYDLLGFWIKCGRPQSMLRRYLASRPYRNMPLVENDDRAGRYRAPVLLIVMRVAIFVTPNRPVVLTLPLSTIMVLSMRKPSELLVVTPMLYVPLTPEQALYQRLPFCPATV